ncbi:sulfotransferase domain-containing protein [Sphingobium lignivorans]|uniref:Sulfotransferase domain-containing protein n=1 Tax=Sphingobium lignivorans TaxID=2735886 RepID=A0ABR6NEF6_9SPHN|nr:sulfotransferase domain-containing protein [Sphingobium lignivorans]MBB5985654.1 hypothetical protein [Sphingobium lignivorans]
MRPNLFILGAPKCGTSSLFDWLARHPDVRGSRVKEPFFLTDPAHPLSRRPNAAADGLEAYQTLFAPADADAPIRMEGTTHYVFDPMARDVISGMADARAIIVLREPAMRVYSSFQYTLNNLARLRPGLSFARYLELMDSGTPLMPDWCRHPGSAYVLEREVTYSRYILHVAPWLEALGPDRLKLLVMEDMVRDPNGTVDGLLDWLGLDPSTMPRMEKAARNRTESIRMSRLQATARYLNARIRPPAALRDVLKRGYGALQYRTSRGMPAEDARAIESLRGRLAADNAALAALTGLDLAAWSIAKPAVRSA